MSSGEMISGDGQKSSVDMEFMDELKCYVDGSYNKVGKVVYDKWF